MEDLYKSTISIKARITSITNEIHYFDEVIPPSKQVRKILAILASSWKSKVNAIYEGKDLSTHTMDKLIRNLKTYKLKKQ